ncbi:MAG: class I SAM-dependent methyltransferase, partial [Magnetococcales bacterium]|nr:class I SAM-dependent methyltransferase [Magnetococcales bacterium]
MAGEVGGVFPEEAWGRFASLAREILGRELSPTEGERFRLYVTELQAANRRFNLMGPGGMAQLLVRHIPESLVLGGVVSGCRRIADM